MRPCARLFPLLLPAVLGGCFDFDATTAGGPLPDAAGGGQDATVPFDGGGADVNVGPAPDGGSYCASLPASAGVVLCDDFDDDASLGSHWSLAYHAGGTLAETDASFESPPYSLDETIDPHQPGDSVIVGLRKQAISLPSQGKTMLFGFSIEPVEIDSPQGAIVLAAIDFLDDSAPTPNRYSVELAINVQATSAAVVLAEQTGFSDGGTGAYQPHALTNPLTIGAWTDLVIAIDWTPPTAARASVRGTGGVLLLSPVTLTMTVQATHLQIGIGTTYVYEPSQQWKLRYDNVSFEIQ